MTTANWIQMFMSGKSETTTTLTNSYKATLARSGAVFATQHDATTAGSFNASSTQCYCTKGTDNNFYIGRLALRFNLSAISGTIKKAYIYVNVYSSEDLTTNIIIQRFTNTGTVVVGDYISFADNYGNGGTKVILNVDKPYLKLELNNNGITYLNTVVGDTANLMIREYTKDYLNVEPTALVNFGSNTIDHFLEVTYG